ncbi:MAG TPA: glycogen debranching protein GlgX [Trichormus sp.]|jgi:glycogen operon protein
MSKSTQTSQRENSEDTASKSSSSNAPESESSSPSRQVLEGRPYPLGSTWDGLGANFAIFSENADKVELCLFDSEDDKRETERIELPEYNNHVWHGYLPNIRPGQLYGYRVYGPWAPKLGQRFNHRKLLLDPYAKAIARPVKWDNSLFAYKIGNANDDLVKDDRDSAAYAPLSVVIDPSFTWGDDKAPDIPWNKTIIYETHVKGMTKLHPALPEELRGTYAGLSHPKIIEHFTSLGITAVELMPVHYRVVNRSFEERGVSDYWGYNTLGFFAPDARFASTSHGVMDAVHEFKMMVRALHAAGIEVILDVVYNHTIEGNHLGPSLSFRGIDNLAYYRTVTKEPRFYMDYTGCGNTLNMMHPRVIQLIMDSLRYWVEEMHVDGFRFDLASALARELHDVDKLGAFFDVIQQDPVISRVKLIAEPWDLGMGGYQVGNFPVLWTEWNGQYRDTARRFIKGDAGVLGQLATRLTGSSDLYEHSGRKPHASINFVTCHDGFTLHDLVSYNEKHNLANKENNQDGENHNNSWNLSVEGPTDDPVVKKLRYQQKRNFIAMLFLSIGVPMLSGGDELGRTQQGNNNAYCQDNEISWYNWDLSEEDKQFLEYVKEIIAIRKRQLVIHRKDFFKGYRRVEGSRVNEIIWLRPDGKAMKETDWVDSERRTFGIVIEGRGIEETDHFGRTLIGHTMLLLCNSDHRDFDFQLPNRKDGQAWNLLVDTSQSVGMLCWQLNSKFQLKARSIALFELAPKVEEEESAEPPSPPTVAPGAS